jgi:hypothetical protein
MPGDVFERIMTEGRSAVLAGDHRAEAPPSEGGRWGTSVVVIPTGLVADHLDRLTTEVIDPLAVLLVTDPVRELERIDVTPEPGGGLDDRRPDGIGTAHARGLERSQRPNRGSHGS